MSTNIFKKIIDREIPADIVYEDERCMVFKDINPVAPVHVLIIPKKEIPSLNDLSAEDQELVGYLFLIAKKVAHQLGIGESGYRTVINCGRDGGQEVPHLHIHLLGGQRLGWPPC